MEPKESQFKIDRSCAVCGKENSQVDVGSMPNLKFCSKEHALEGMKNPVARSLNKALEN